MDFIFSSLGYVLLIIMLVFAGLSLIGLPGTWLILGTAILWQWLYPLPTDMSLGYWCCMVFLVLLGEFLEATIQAVATRRFGARETTLFSDIIEIFTGFFLLTVLRNIDRKRSLKDTGKAVAGSVLGRAGCWIARGVVGLLLVVLSAFYIWPQEESKVVSSLLTGYC